MGRVFVARDLKLDREVAIKVLAPGTHDEDELRRFEQEARAAGSLNHPSILAIYDIESHEGSPYIVSELLQGKTLRERLEGEPLSVRNALDYALQFAQGLTAAHDKGVVHRDLKPENLFITDEERLKILDFGIAKLVDPRGASPPEATRVEARRQATPRKTEPGTILGTVGYMSPEQVRGERADRRSDIFSFGAILYEMLSGKQAFEGASPIETGYAILHDDPKGLPAHVPPELHLIVRRCLEKAPERRFQSARDLLFQLETCSASSSATEPRAPPYAARRRLPRAALAAGALLLALGMVALLARRPLRRETANVPPAERKSIAVLPFVNMSSDKDNEYLSDGMTEELINALANVNGLRVTSRTSAFAFKGKNLSIRKIGGELNAGAVLEGSVRREGSRLRVVAQLINVADGYHVWSNTYERELKNIFAVEEELARSIVRALKPKLVPADAAPLVRPGTTNLAAHDLYLKGRYLWNKRTTDALTKAIAYFQQDPTYALAYVGLADSTALLFEYGPASATEALPKAKEAALKALELDGTLAEAHASLGLIDVYNYEWADAEREYRRAIELKPEYPTARHWYAILLMSTGRVEEARAEAERAQQLDPTSLIINTLVTWTLYAAREYDAAVEQAKKTIELDPEFLIPRHFLARATIAQGRYADAVAELEKLRGISAPFPSYAGELGYAYAMSGERAEALRVLAELERGSTSEHLFPIPRALIYLGLGDKDQAFAWLDKAYAKRDWRLRELNAYRLFDSLRSDPRFSRLLKQMHLE